MLKPSVRSLSGEKKTVVLEILLRQSQRENRLHELKEAVATVKEANSVDMQKLQALLLADAAEGAVDLNTHQFNIDTFVWEAKANPVPSVPATPAPAPSKGPRQKKKGACPTTGSSVSK